MVSVLCVPEFSELFSVLFLTFVMADVPELRLVPKLLRWRTKAGDEFLLWQSASRHILVFGTGSNIRLLAAMRTWGMDGTFKVVPQWYQQLFTIHAFVAGKLMPAVYCLCTGLLPEYAGTGLLLPLLPCEQKNKQEKRLECSWPPLSSLYRKLIRVLACLKQATRILIAEQGVMDTLIRQVLSGNATVGDLRRVNRVYVEKQQRVEQYTGEYTNGSRTLEQFLEALMYITPEPI
ncbi:hypothetical protein T10_8862 [Trichinella papuae]|uniref:Uncharacterized protein n=1 Tax=Trichinella papuae TaxID=268474 RepID=A0A0V1M2E9_9BILA|nr:hypothetical protein T10_8862 [Trichinella papuae]